MFRAVKSPYLVPFDNKFRVASASTEPPAGAPDKDALEEKLEALVDEMADLQRKLYASDDWSVLLVFQAMDAAGKDSTIRKVLTGVNPAGFQVYSFKAPSKEELDHDFLWRSAVRLPERGRIGVFNRSYYEEVLVVKVHPEYLQGQRLPDAVSKRIWRMRYESIREHELHLARNGTVVIKFWLNVSKDEQARRFLRRIDDERKNWKFNRGDLEERKFWDDYMAAYQGALRATSRPWAPWYAIPADDKPYMRWAVADTIVRSLRRLKLEYPELHRKEKTELGRLRRALQAELDPTEG